MRLLFFHRLDLVHLYAPLSKELHNEYEIIHVAFSEKEVEILRNDYSIEGNIFNLSTLREEFYQSLTLNDKVLNELDDFIISATNGQFCLNSSIYLDRTYVNLNYEEANFMSVVYYKIWAYIFDLAKPDLFFHEPPALMMTHLAAMFCKMNHAKYLTQIQVAGLHKYQWLFLEGDDARFVEFDLNKLSKPQDLSFDLARNFIKKSNEDLGVLLNDLVVAKATTKKFKLYYLMRGITGSIIRAIKSLKIKKIDPREHIDEFLKRNHKSFIIEVENLYGRLYDSYYSSPEISDKYYFYPLHLEPEAVVLYYAAGWYEGQLKLIENIAAQLPPNTFLYVKDHPHGGNYRDVKDYKRLLKIRNVKIIDPAVSGKQIIKNAVGVITINGTAGFEALLMNKKVFCFGRAFYTNFKSVVYINDIKQLRKELYNKDQHNLDIEEIQLFLESSHPGYVSYFAGRQNKIGISLNENIILISNDIRNFCNKILHENNKK